MILSFKEFVIEEVQKSTREGIQHLQGMKDLDFLDLVDELKKTNGILKNIPIQLKIDFLGFRFGLDSNGKPFVESSRSGPIYDEGSFSRFTAQKGNADEVSIIRANHYDEILKYFIRSPLMKLLPNDTKVIVEVGYNPMAETSGDWLKFVTVKYDKNKLGTLMTLFPHKVLIASSGKPHPEERSILDSLYAASNDKIKVVSPYLKSVDIDISGKLDILKSLNVNARTILSSRKAIDKIEKESIKVIIQRCKEDIADYIIKHPKIEGKYDYGPDIEGLILQLDSGNIKVTTPEFKESKRK